jgi:hypothetical protein
MTNDYDLEIVPLHLRLTSNISCSITRARTRRMLCPSNNHTMTPPSSSPLSPVVFAEALVLTSGADRPSGSCDGVTSTVCLESRVERGPVACSGPVAIKPDLAWTGLCTRELPVYVRVGLKRKSRGVPRRTCPKIARAS